MKNQTISKALAGLNIIGAIGFSAYGIITKDSALLASGLQMLPISILWLIVSFLLGEIEWHKSVIRKQIEEIMERQKWKSVCRSAEQKK